MLQSKLPQATIVLVSMVKDIYWINLLMISLLNSMAKSQENIHLIRVYLALMEQVQVKQVIPNNVPNTQQYLNSKVCLLREKFIFKKHWIHLNLDTSEPIFRNFWKRQVEVTSTFMTNILSKWLISDYLQQQILYLKIYKDGGI